MYILFHAVLWYYCIMERPAQTYLCTFPVIKKKLNSNNGEQTNISFFIVEMFRYLNIQRNTFIRRVVFATYIIIY